MAQFPKVDLNNFDGYLDGKLLLPLGYYYLLDENSGGYMSYLNWEKWKWRQWHKKSYKANV